MAVDMFLKLEGITGESKDHKHKDEIDVLAHSWGASQPSTAHHGGGGGAGKVVIDSITITKYLDRSSQPLLSKAMSGEHIPHGTLTVRRAGEKPLEFLKIKLIDIIVTNLQQGAVISDERVTENVALDFARFTYEYREQKADGSGQPGGEMGWDIKKNEKV